MWKDFSISYMKKNRTSSVSIAVAAFISALFLSLICSLFFNLWTYELEQIISEDGAWQGRISGNLREEDLAVIQNFANVENVIMNTKLSDELQRTIDICFTDPKTIFTDMPLIAERLGIEKEGVIYHEVLLSRYLIHNPEDITQPLLLTFYLIILMLISISLILIIHNSFAVSMHERIHQFGILSSIGATPEQIRSCLLQEAAVLCTIPILLGSVVGIGGSYCMIKLINIAAEGMSGRQEAVFQYHPVIYAITILSAAATVIISAWLPARKLSKLTPLEAIKNTGEFTLKKKKHSPMLIFLFGIEGELAGNELKAQRRALRASTLSLTLSFLAFTLMLCFFSLSGISKEHTYFEKYQDMWDLMITVKDTEINDFNQMEVFENIPEIRNRVVYQKATAVSVIPTENQSSELLALGGIETVAGNVVTETEAGYLIQTPLIILEDAGFLEYCEQIGIPATLDGAVILNRIWDSVNSNFRYAKYVPYIKEEQNTIFLQNTEKDTDTAKLPIQGFTQETPVLREEYDNYALTVFLPLSMWKELSEQIEVREKDTFIRVLGKEGITLEELHTLETTLSETLGLKYEIDCENRIQEKMEDKTAQTGMMGIIGVFCAVLAIIGIANVFSNTLGFIQQRKREFARYASIGMTLGKMRKIFCIEALVIAGRPILITLPVTALAVAYMINVSYLDPYEFLVKVPIMPIFIFIIIIFLFVGLAYYLGGKRIMKGNLIDLLRDDSLL